MNEHSIEQDIWHWVENYIEKPHAFYNYKFPPCPFARAARLKKLLDVKVYTSGSLNQFIATQTQDLIKSDLNTRILVFPHYVRWFYWTKWAIKQLNKTTIPQDYYLQYGRAVGSHSQYPGLFSQRPYFVVIINKLSDVMEGHQMLAKTDYYSNWSHDHYRDVVVRRQKTFEKYFPKDTK
jgi:hypothetical protein